jgi:hypothetical protein
MDLLPVCLARPDGLVDYLSVAFGCHGALTETCNTTMTAVTALGRVASGSHDERECTNPIG